MTRVMEIMKTEMTVVMGSHDSCTCYVVGKNLELVPERQRGTIYISSGETFNIKCNFLILFVCK